MACRRVTSATCTWARPPARPSLLWTHRRDTRAPASTKARRSIKLFTDLPTSALDGATGNPLPALEPFVTQEKRKRRPKVAKQCQSQSQEPQQEVEADTSVESPFARLFELGPDGQEWPPLAKDVLSNLVRFPGCILLTRVGGFYESYFEQAPLLAGMLSIKLANRSWGGRSVPMAGFPLSQLEKYLKVLVQDHRKLVAICEEFRSDDDGRVPELNEKVDIVRRVTRVVSPGTLIDEKWLDPLRNNFILSVSRDAINDTYGLAWLDLSTSDLHVSCCQGIEELRDEVHRVSPSEIVLEQQSDLDRMQEIIDLQRSLVSIVPSVQDADFLGALESQATQTYPHTERLALANLTSHLRSRLLDIPADAVITAGLVRHHTPEDFMAIDGNTLDALEVRETNREGGIRGSLVSTVRRTLTKGGSRLLVEWLTSPSTSWEVITQRHAVVEYFVNNKFVHEDIRALFRMIQRGDISRTLQRVATARNDEQDLLEVRDFARFISALQQAITELRQGNKQETEGMDLLNKMICSLSNLDALADELGNAIDERVMDDRIRAMEALETDEEGGTGGSVTPARKTPATKSRTEAEEPWGAPFEHLIRPSSSKVLTRLTREYDRLRRNATALQTSLKERFPSSKVSLRFLLGQGFVVHFAGISKANGSDEADDLAVATKTKTTRTFYHDPWSQIGSRILRLQEELKRAENAELRRLRRVVMEASSDLRRNAQKVDELDCLLGFAQLAGDMRLVRPTMVRQTDGQGLDEDDIPFEVEAGRHIGVEGGLLEHGRAFTPNDLNMDSNSRIHFIVSINGLGDLELMQIG